MRFKPVLRFDEAQKHFRLFRLLWENGRVGDGRGYSAKLSIALTPHLWHFSRGVTHNWLVTVFGLRVGYARSYGGIFG